jgi:Uma2 family endonuclease
MARSSVTPSLKGDTGRWCTAVGFQDFRTGVSDWDEAMVTQMIQLPRLLPGGRVIAVDVSEDEYMQHYAESHHEWVGGAVVKMSPITFQHDELTGYLRELLRAYFALRPVGIVKSAPFVMRLALPDRTTRREPDLQVILGEHHQRVGETYTDGPADICIEVVSPRSVAVDYGEKLEEYEQGGVREYWLLDPLRTQGLFHRLTEAGHYRQAAVDPTVYTTPLLPGFQLHIPVLWQPSLPDFAAVWQQVQEMLVDDDEQS